MKNILFLMTAITAFGQNQTPIQYPKTEKGFVIDTYFDAKVPDPYRWLEDDRSPKTEAWVKAQNKVTFEYLNQIPFRNAIKTRMEQLWNYEKEGTPFVEGKFTYYYKNNGLQNQSVLYRKDQSGREQIFLDPNTFSTDGTTSMGEISFSKDGSLVAYSISEGGSDWRKVIILNAVTKQPVDETIIDVKFSGLSWFGNKGFYYSSYEKPKGSELSAKTDQHKLYFHAIGTKQKLDKVIFGESQKRRYVGGSVTEDDHFLVITAANSTYGNELYIQDLSKPNSAIITLVDNFESDNTIIDNQGNQLFIETDFQAPNKRIVTVDFQNPTVKNWKNFISENQNVLNISTAGGYFFAHYMQDAVSVVAQYDTKGQKLRTIQLPDLGTASGFSGKKKEKILYYTFTNYTTAGNSYALDTQTGKSTLYRKSKAQFQSDNYETHQVFYPSKDGTKIPMMITHKKGIQLNGQNPTILYGYGGFNISLTPNFSISNAVWMENGGIYAVANLRGGGEYGKKWHDAGIQQQKQNVFDDCIAAAEYLIAHNYTSPKFLALRGGSNGGLLVGAVMIQRPDLMQVALPAVGVLDMLRYHTFTAGAGWSYDYGTAQDSKPMFDYLRNYSPIHNVKAGTQYPATLITTGDHDDRVVPAHSFKFAAELQDKQTGSNPTLIRIDVKAGHGAGKSVTATIQENVDIQSFTLYNMGITQLPK
ncbi:prolyl oligopeptidase family serine peptidase [Flavobacterium sp.]|uniref:prolyl oligopeptidase family serine peptidase n=1 Tax=Flavobacterium sp. TaxID=239 RepID=UPI003C42E8B5